MGAGRYLGRWGRAPMQIDYSPAFAAYDRIQNEILARTEARAGNALQCFLRREAPTASSGFQRMSRCR